MRSGAPLGASSALRGCSRQVSLGCLPRAQGRVLNRAWRLGRSQICTFAANGNNQGDVAEVAAELTARANADADESLAASASAPRPAQQQQQQQQQAPASTSGRPSPGPAPLRRLEAAGAALARKALDAAAAAAPEPPLQVAAVQLLPEQDYGNLRGGQYPFLYDPVYGLPVVREVVRYGELLRDIRQQEVSQLLWFFDPKNVDPFYTDGRCLVRYRDGRVKQAVVPPGDVRIPYAMDAHGVEGVKVPLEPRHVAEYAAWDDAGPRGPLWRAAARLAGGDAAGAAGVEGAEGSSRRGPRVGPTAEELVLTLGAAEKDKIIDQEQAAVRDAAASLQRLPTEDWEAYEAAGRTYSVPDKSQAAEARKAFDREAERLAALAEKKSWSDNIIISQDTQAFIYKYVPIIGPIIGSAFVLGLYIFARLLRGDLTDRLKMMDSEEEKRRRTALREARIAFLEEEVPALVARGADMAALTRKMAEVNKRLGEKFEISASELLGTYDACRQLMEAGEDLDTGAGAATAADRILAEQEALDKRDAAAAAEGGEGGQQSAGDALMEMGKLNTARIRKAVDPRVMDVKKRVRAARRSLKRESKVQLSDEIIFFDDVAGNEQAKVELMEVVDFFRQPEKFRVSGAKAPKGVLLVGPPGNGKTLMARAVAGESGVAFISSSASEFIEMYMGLGAARVRDLFNTARKLAPCIIFIDELDAVGRARRSGAKGGNDERDNTVNQLLTEMDGFEAERTGIVVMGATNRKDVLDAALTRPGRFDRSIEVMRPDFKGRLECIKVHLRDKPIAVDIDYSRLAVLTGGMSGAQIAGAANAACFLASREGRSDVGMEDLVKAIDQARFGKSYETHGFVSPVRKRRFAVMEGAISLAATLLPAIEPVDHVTIQPSSKSPLGRTVLKPNIARYTTGLWTKEYLRQQLLVALASRAAEEVVFGIEELSSLNQARLQFARQIVHRMLNAGMSAHPDFENIRTLGHNYMDPSMEQNRWTQYTTITDTNQSRSEWIDTDMEMEAMLNDGYAEVKSLMERNRPALDTLVEALLEEEQLPGDRVRAIVEEMGHPADLARRRDGAEAAFV